jgi:predicted O-methyltransferase YrrM
MLDRIRHWSPRYVCNRLAAAKYERVNPDAPWLTRQMIEILDYWLKPNDVGVEWGSGRSTAWLAARVSHLTTIEENAEWADRVDSMLAQHTTPGRVELLRAPLSDTDHRNPAASQYVALGRGLAASSLAFALVDGALRDHCAAVAIDKLKRGGVLIIDNVERYIPREIKSAAPVARSLSDGFETAEWERVFEAIKEWRCVWTSNGVTDTAFWVKP